MLYYRYAEKYPSIQPQHVPDVVTAKAFMRWLVMERSEASRAIWQRYWQADDKQKFLAELSQEENELRLWAMIEGEY